MMMFCDHSGRLRSNQRYMDIVFGFFELRVINNTTLVGCYANNHTRGRVFPEMAQKNSGDSSSIAGRYQTFWLQDSGNPYAVTLDVRPSENDNAFHFLWQANAQSFEFRGVGHFVERDRIVGYYHMEAPGQARPNVWPGEAPARGH